MADDEEKNVEKKYTIYKNDGTKEFITATKTEALSIFNKDKQAEFILDGVNSDYVWRGGMWTVNRLR